MQVGKTFFQLVKKKNTFTLINTNYRPNSYNYKTYNRTNKSYNSNKAFAYARPDNLAKSQT